MINILYEPEVIASFWLDLISTVLKNKIEEKNCCNIS